MINLEKDQEIEGERVEEAEIEGEFCWVHLFLSLGVFLVASNNHSVNQLSSCQRV